MLSIGLENAKLAILACLPWQVNVACHLSNAFSLGYVHIL